MMQSIAFMTSGLLDNLLTKTLIMKPCSSSTSQGVIWPIAWDRRTLHKHFGYTN